MKIFFIVLAIVLTSVIVFLILGILTYYRNLKKDKYDLLNYLKKHKDSFSITIKENGVETLAINADKRFPLASTLKIVIAFNFVKAVMNGDISVTDQVKVNDLDKFYIINTDGGAHPEWKSSIDHPTEVSLLEVAKGMMQFSSNACTDYLIYKIGVDVINASLETLQMNDHDKITYLTPSVIIPGYLSDQKKIAIHKIESMNIHSYQNLSKALFEKMMMDECDALKEKVPKMLSKKIQLSITKKLPFSTTKEYTNLMLRLGKEFLTEEEKALFSEILIGKNFKDDQDDYLWYKGGSTLFALTSAFYKESQGNTISISLFMEDDTGGELYWINGIFNNFIGSIAKDTDFRKKVKELAN